MNRIMLRLSVRLKIWSSFTHCDEKSPLRTGRGFFLGTRTGSPGGTWLLILMHDCLKIVIVPWNLI